MTTSTDLSTALRSAIKGMDEMPTNLHRAIKNAAEAREIKLEVNDGALISLLQKLSINDEGKFQLGEFLRKWDSARNVEWAKGTMPGSSQRRCLIEKRLGASEKVAAVLLEEFPVFTSEDEPVVIAATHEEWYHGKYLDRRKYWDAYTSFLRSRPSWRQGNAIGKLDLATDRVVERLSEPSRPKVYATRGLVVGYVQSGKTAHFTGLVAKSIDAGYRMIIVLAGTTDVLRAQTQRRLDKELLGREMVGMDYADAPDFAEFNPWHAESTTHTVRLTGPGDDYKTLGKGIRTLEFARKDKSKPQYDEGNLQDEPPRLVVLKKNAQVINRLVSDIDKIKERLRHIPTLVIDDESDQASINTVDPRKTSSEDNKKITATNNAIRRLLELLPRAQYVGYTATPFANVFINPQDAKDLFPRDFIVALERPAGYMGVSDFCDFDGVPKGYASKKAAFVRDVRGQDSDSKNLQAALDSFVLSGAMKLYREQKSPGTVLSRHHTMLIHHSALQKIHSSHAELVRKYFMEGKYLTSIGMKRLERLFVQDYRPVSLAQEPGAIVPRAFHDLKKCVGDCIGKLLDQGEVRVLVVNGESRDTPDFDEGPVWAILIGGAKLSRGYTVEGLTVTYYRRIARAADTLMQMGRWFGYRGGYRDLVRLYIGREEPSGAGGKKKIDLYEMFRAIGIDEEDFREEITKYVKESGERITPQMIPPLVQSHLEWLRPTAKNKMFSAVLRSKNFGGQWKERTTAPTSKKLAKTNEFAALELLRATKNLTMVRLEDHAPESKSALDCYVGTLPLESLLQFLKIDYKWEPGSAGTSQEVEFLEKAIGDPEIDKCLLVVPANKSLEKWKIAKKELGKHIGVRKRERIGKRVSVYSEPNERPFIRYLAMRGGVSSPSENLKKLAERRQCVLFLTPVRAVPDDFDTVGFALQFPENSIKRRLAWSAAGKKGDEIEFDS